MSLSIANLAKAFGVQNADIVQGAVGYEQEKDKLTNQLYVLGVLLLALVFGIVAVILLSTGVSDLESYGDYFSGTGHTVGIGFAAATLITLFVAGFMLDSSLECAEVSRAKAFGPPFPPPPPPPLSPRIPNIVGSVSPYVGQPSPYSPQVPQSPRFPRPQVYAQQPVYARPQMLVRPPPPRPPPNVRYPVVPSASPVAVTYPAVPQASPVAQTAPISSLSTAIPVLANIAAPIALAAANAPQGQRGFAALNAALPQQ